MLIITAGTLYINYFICNYDNNKIAKFNKNKEEFWKECECEDFENDFKYSSKVYFITSALMIGFGAIKFVCSLFIWCCSDKGYSTSIEKS